MVHAREFRGSHTANAITNAIEEMLRDWKIDKKRVHVVLRDNAANMKKAMDQLGVPSLGCFAHSLQLVVHEGMLSQRAVSDAIANGRKIVAHFTFTQGLFKPRRPTNRTEYHTKTSPTGQDTLEQYQMHD